MPRLLVRSLDVNLIKEMHMALGQVLILKKDVTNKKADRQKTRDGWAVQAWKKGSRWLQSETVDGEDLSIKPLNLGYASPHPWFVVERDYGLSQDDFEVKTATTWKDVSLEEGDWSSFAGEVLEVLIQREAVSLEDVRAALRSALDSD